MNYDLFKQLRVEHFHVLLHTTLNICFFVVWCRSWSHISGQDFALHGVLLNETRRIVVRRPVFPERDGNLPEKLNANGLDSEKSECLW